MHPSWSRATLHTTGFGSLPNQSGAFSVFQWLCGLSFSDTYHKPTCHKTGPVDTPHLYDFVGSNHELQFLCLLVEAFLLPSSSLEYSCNAILSTSASFLAFKAQSMCRQSYRMTSKSGAVLFAEPPLGKILNHIGPQFPHLKNGDNIIYSLP